MGSSKPRIKLRIKQKRVKKVRVQSQSLPYVLNPIDEVEPQTVIAHSVNTPRPRRPHPTLRDLGTIATELSLDSPNTRVQRADLSKIPVSNFRTEIELDDLVSVLSIHAKSKPACSAMLDLLQFEENHTVPLARLCLEADLDWSEFVQLFKDFKLDSAAIIAHREFPDLMRDTMEDAKTKEVACPRCFGVGHVDAAEVGLQNKLDGPVACPDCLGEKKIRRIGDRTARLIVFESLGQIKKRGPMVAINQQFVSGGGQSEFITVGQKLLELGSDDYTVHDD